MCTVFTTLKLARHSSCSFTSLNQWALFELLQLSHFHTPAHAYTLTRVSGLKCESEYRKEVEEHIIVCQTPLPRGPLALTVHLGPLRYLCSALPLQAHTHTHSGTLSPWQCFAMKFRPFLSFLLFGSSRISRTLLEVLALTNWRERHWGMVGKWRKAAFSDHHVEKCAFVSAASSLETVNGLYGGTLVIPCNTGAIKAEDILITKWKYVSRRRGQQLLKTPLKSVWHPLISEPRPVWVHGLHIRACIRASRRHWGGSETLCMLWFVLEASILCGRH